MNQWQDPRKQAGNDLVHIAIIAAVVALVIAVLASIQPFKANAQSPEPFWAPHGTIAGPLYISNGENIDTLYGAILFMPGEPTGTLLLADEQGNMTPAGEVTITYWVEPEPTQ